MANPTRSITTLRERIETSDDISTADRDRLLAFSDRLALLKSQYSDHRHVKLLSHCTQIAIHVGGLADALTDRTAAEGIVRWIHRTYDNEETNRDYRVALRMFAKHVTDGKNIPPSVEWVSGTTPSNYDPTPNPAEMLHWDEHVTPMIDACRNSRDRALIAVAWDAGARSGELRSPTVGDVTAHKHGLRITVDGKMGQRSVTLIPSVPYLRKWLDDHPSGCDTDPLWTKLHDPDGVSYEMVIQILNQAADWAGVDRPVTPTNFRKSAASYLASQGLSQAHIEEHHGWTRGSKVAARYISVFGDATDAELARIYGRDRAANKAEANDDPIGPIVCPRCQRETPREKEFCVWCDQVLEPETASQLKEDERSVQREIFHFAKDNPDLLAAIEEHHEFAELLEDDPELVERARRFADAVENGS
jgi:hypothetical protein